MKLTFISETSGEMICILLVAGHASSLESEIKNHPTGQYQHLEGIPKVTTFTALNKKLGRDKFSRNYQDTIDSQDSLDYEDNLSFEK